MRLTTVLSLDGDELRTVRVAAGETTVETARGTVVHREVSEGWDVAVTGGRVPLRGLRRTLATGPLELVTAETTMRREIALSASVPHLLAPPPLNGTLDGFLDSDPIVLDLDDHYRRSEEPYAGADQFSATATLGWDETALYVAVDVRHPAPTFPATDAPPLRLDNEPDLIHADGVQLYLQLAGGAPLGWLIVPDPASDRVQVRAADGTQGDAAQVRGAWSRSEEGYVITVALTVPGWPPSSLAMPRDSICWSTRCSPVGNAAPVSWSGVAGQAGSISGAIGTPRPASAGWHSREDSRLHLDRQQAAGSAVRCRRADRAAGKARPCIGGGGLGQ